MSRLHEDGPAHLALAAEYILSSFPRIRRARSASKCGLPSLDSS